MSGHLCLSRSTLVRPPIFDLKSGRRQMLRSDILEHRYSTITGFPWLLFLQLWEDYYSVHLLVHGHATYLVKIWKWL